MRTFKNYEVVYIKNGKHLIDIVETFLTKKEIEKWFITNKQAFMILRIEEFLGIPKDIIRI